MTNISNGNLCPCIRCEVRDAECHSRCSAYSHWKKQWDKQRDLKNKAKDEDSFFRKPRKHRYTG